VNAARFDLAACCDLPLDERCGIRLSNASSTGVSTCCRLPVTQPTSRLSRSIVPVIARVTGDASGTSVLHASRGRKKARARRAFCRIGRVQAADRFALYANE